MLAPSPGHDGDEARQQLLSSSGYGDDGSTSSHVELEATAFGERSEVCITRQYIIIIPVDHHEDLPLQLSSST